MLIYQINNNRSSPRLLPINLSFLATLAVLDMGLFPGVGLNQIWLVTPITFVPLQHKYIFQGG